MRFLLYFVLIAIFIDNAMAKPLKKVAIPNTEVQYVKYAINDVDYKLFISIPKQYKETDEKYNVLYLLDAHYSFAIVNNIVEFLSDRNIIPKMIIVGIGYVNNDTHKRFKGYESADFSTYKLNRTRDYLPISKNTEDTSYSEIYDKFSGNGEKFQAVLTQIQSFVNKKYRTNGDDTIIGHSYGGLFGAWTLITNKDLFNKYILISPSLWYEDNYIMNLLNDLNFEKNDNIKMYITVGAFETERMIKGVENFSEYFNNKVILKQEIAQHKDHETIFPGSVTDALMFMFSKTE